MVRLIVCLQGIRPSPLITTVRQMTSHARFESIVPFCAMPNNNLDPTANLNPASAQHTTKYGISRFDRVMLTYGAICGFLLVVYATGNVWLAFMLGIPPGVFGFGVPMLISKHLNPSPSQFATLPVSKQRQILLVAGVSFAGWLGYRAIIGDWFGFACTTMLAGGLLLLFANEYGYWN